MRYKINISKNWRKIISAYLLLSFFISPILASFPKQKCDGVCETIEKVHDCCSDESKTMKISCCNMMEMNSKNSNLTPFKYRVEISNLKCSYIFHSEDNATYMIPKTNENSTENIKITIFDLNYASSISKRFDLNSQFSSRDKPPLYLFNESFLI